MRACLLLVTSFMTVFLLTKCHGQEACPTGWFGDSCKYQCHCNVSATCLAHAGECPPNDMCARGFFGPGCQYYDVVSESSTQSFATDGDDNTCNPAAVATTLVIEWNKTYAYRWIRVVFESPGQSHNFHVRLNGNLYCTNKRLYAVDEFTVDVYCTIFDPVIKLELYGPATDTVCSIYVTPGRNFALKQQASQSTEFPFSRSPEETRASNAVDGNTNSSLSGLSCAHTDHQELPWWKLLLNRPYDLTSIYIYNRDLEQSRLPGFIATTYTGTSKNVVYRDNHQDVTSVYKVNLVSTRAITSIEIKQPLSGWISICEVQMYGDVVCPDGKYGLDCELDCTCRNNESCSLATGACSPDRCPRGAFGYKCSQRCDKNCTRDYCMQNTGYCTYCPDGFTGDLCNLECGVGTYGGRCQSTCSINCLNTCDRRTGACDCKDRYTGLRCDKCLNSFHGDNCSLSCSERCVNRTCDRLSGHCISCSRNTMGPNCNDCVAGYFGPQCLNRCPGNCLEKSCNRQTGKCKSCSEGFKGDKCSTVCSGGTYGRDCMSACSKDCKGTCHPKSGVCVCNGSRAGPRCDVCIPGMYGPDCRLKCSPYCRDTCDYKTGKCSCAGRRAGLHCKECQTSWYGDNCSQPCSGLCSGKICERITGECASCVRNRIGPNCEECKFGWFGAFCAEQCSPRCTDHVCNGVTGACFSCLGAYKGVFCQDCPAGFYGDACTRPCRGTCVNKTCNIVTGRCVACAAGYSGNLCTRTLGFTEGISEPRKPHTLLLLLLIPQAVIVFLCFFAFYQHLDDQVDLNTTDTAVSTYRGDKD